MATTIKGMTATLAKLLLCTLLALGCGFGAALMKTERADAYTGGLDVYVGYSGGPYYLKSHIDHSRLMEMADRIQGTNNLYPYQYVYHTGEGSDFALRKFVGCGVRMESIFNFLGYKPQDIFRFQIGTGDGYIPDDGGRGYENWTYNELVGATRYYYDGFRDIGNFSYSNGTVLNEGGLTNSRSTVPSILALNWGSMQYDSGTTQEQLNQTWDSISVNKTDYRLFYGQGSSPLSGNPRGSAQDVRAITIVLGGNDGTEKAEIDIEPPTDKNGNVVTELEVGQDFSLGVSMSAHDWFVAQEALKNGDVQIISSNEDVLQVYFDEATGSYRVKVVGEGTATISYRFGNGQEEYVVQGVGFSMTGKGHGNGEGDDVGDGSGDAGGNGGADAGDQDGSADGTGVVLGAGTTLTPINFTPKLAISEGSGEAPNALGDAGGADAEEIPDEEIPEADPVTLEAKKQTYRLDEEEPELEEEQEPYLQLPPDWQYGAGGLALLGAGAMTSAVRFRQLKDPDGPSQRG